MIPSSDTVSHQASISLQHPTRCYIIYNIVYNVHNTLCKMKPECGELVMGPSYLPETQLVRTETLITRSPNCEPPLVIDSKIVYGDERL